MKQLFLLFTIALSCAAHSQQQTFDLVSYTAPKNWQKKTAENALQLIKQDQATGSYCIINLYKSVPSAGDGKTNFNAAWETLVKEALSVTADAEMQPEHEEDGWNAQSGYAQFELDGSKGIAMLVTTTGFEKAINILILTNSGEYETTITDFLSKVDIKKPAVTDHPKPPVNNTVNNTNGGSKPSAAGGFAYHTTNFDNGWTSTVYDDYILVTRGNIKVHLSYIMKFNASDFTGTGIEARDYYWDNYVSKYFTTGEKKSDRAGFLSDFSQEYIEGWATDKQTGEKRYIGMIVNILAYTGNFTMIIASAPDEAQLRQQFPNINKKFSNDLLPMYGYNKFAIGKNDLDGHWVSGGNGAAISWYSTTTGNNVGTTAVATGHEFWFNPNGTYSSKHNGATGWVGSMNTFQQNYKGAYSISGNWEVTVTKRWEGKTEKMEAWFEIVKGGRILHLKESSVDYTLFKEK